MKTNLLAIASDHAGFTLKQFLVKNINLPTWEVLDLGCNSTDSVDYPDYAQLVIDKITSHKAQLGVLICSTGIGMSIAANRSSEIRAALCLNEEMAVLAKEHNDANVIVFSEKFMSSDQALTCLHKFINSQFSSGRHLQRVEKLNLKGLK